MDPLTGATIGIAGFNALRSLFGGGKRDEVPQSQSLERLLNMQTQQFQQSQPLRDAILRLAMGLLPVSARQGMG